VPWPVWEPLDRRSWALHRAAPAVDMHAGHPAPRGAFSVVR